MVIKYINSKELLERLIQSDHFKKIWVRIWQKVPYGCVNQNLANVNALMYYLLRAFPEILKQLS